MPSRTPDNETQTLPLATEIASVEKRSVATSRIVAETRTDVVEQLAKAELSKDDVQVLHVPVGRQVTAAPSIRTEGDLTIIPVLEEIIHVEKRLVLVEEIHIRRERRHETVEVPVALRRQKVVITRVPPKQSQEDIDMTFEPGAGTRALSTGNDRTITAFFDNRDDAQEAVDALRTQGVASSDIEMIAGNNPETGPESAENRPYKDEGFWASLANLFMPDEDRYTYAEGLQRGGYLVTVQTTSADYEAILAILDREGSVDLDDRSSNWRSAGWDYQAKARSSDLADNVMSRGMEEDTGLLGEDRNLSADERRTATSDQAIPMPRNSFASAGVRSMRVGSAFGVMWLSSRLRKTSSFAGSASMSNAGLSIAQLEPPTLSRSARSSSKNAVRRPWFRKKPASSRKCGSARKRRSVLRRCEARSGIRKSRWRTSAAAKMQEPPTLQRAKTFGAPRKRTTRLPRY